MLLRREASTRKSFDDGLSRGARNRLSERRRKVKSTRRAHRAGSRGGATLTRSGGAVTLLNNYRKGVRGPCAQRQDLRFPVGGVERLMQLLAPDILAEARGLSPLLTFAGLAIGLFLWLFGGRAHRFWLALALTLTAGLVGLMYGPAYGMQPLVAGLLLAVSVGALALAVVRILVFAAGGLAGLVLAQAVAPHWDEQLACFLAGGLVGVWLYRFWITALASLTGTLLMAYSGLCLADRFGKVNSSGLATRNGALLNWACASITAVGLVVQFLLDRRRRRRQQRQAALRHQEEEKARRPAPPPPPPPAPAKPPRSPWWRWGHKASQRRAG